MALHKLQRRVRIKRSIRNRISGTAEQPRLSVFRSNKQIYAQLIDDISGKTLVSASSKEKDAAKGNTNKKDQAKLVGQLLAKKSLDAKIDQVKFDRNGYLYHGRIKSLADAAREAGLKF